MTLASQNLEAAGDVLEIHKTMVKEIDVHKNMQEAEDKWTARKEEMNIEYKALKEKIAQLEEYGGNLNNDLEARKKSINEKKRAMVEIERVETYMQSVLKVIVERLCRFITSDLPFLTEERLRRVEELKSILPRTDISLAEKCRRTFEALQVETEYGRNLQVNAQIINMSDRVVAVDVLNIGRLSLFCRTPDGKSMGWYNRATERWEPLSDQYNRDINQAFEMALHRHPLEVIPLPLGRINTL